MFKVYCAQASRAFVWLLYLYGGSLGSYLPIALQNEIFKISQTWVGSRVFDKIFYLHQIGLVQAIAEPIQFQLHHTTSYINIDVHFSSCQHSMVLLTLTILAQFYFTLRQVGPSVIITLGHRAPSCTTWCAIGPYQIHW